MKKFIITLIIIVATVATSASQEQERRPLRMAQLSEGAYASLLTCGPGDEFYETFGHSALRVCDTARRIDVVFNYGTYDFETEHFYLKFACGRLDYCVVALPMNEFMFEYECYGRSVVEQRLCLSHEELERLYNNLRRNVQKKNMYYKYDFFRDNCATRVRDMIDTSLIGRRLPKATIPTPKASYRDMIYKYSEVTQLWWRLGVDLLLGARCDITMTDRQYMYIPLEMRHQFDTLLLTDGARPTQASKTILDEQRPDLPRSVSPTICFWLMFAIVAALTFLALRQGWTLRWLDSILFATTFAIALLLLFLWFGSDHWCTKWNMNLLWANPLFIVPLLRLRRGAPRLTLALIAILVVFTVGIPLWPQHINSAVLPIALTLIIRLTHYFKYTKKTIIKPTS